MKILLISMPFGPIEWPSIGLSLLKAHMEQIDVKCDVKYFNLDYAAELGADNYLKISQDEPDTDVLLGETIFSSALFPERQLQQLEWLNKIKCDEKLIEIARKAHSEASFFIEKCYRKVDWSDYDVVGFSSTFQQNIAALALAKYIKEKGVKAQVVFGGRNIEDIMGYELLQQFNFIDWVVNGDGDISFVEAVKQLRDKKEISIIKGIFNRKENQPYTANWTQPVTDMNTLPYPNYDDYFEQLNERPMVKDYVQPILLFETARGCWWGKKSHCTFCGLNPETIFFRSKSNSRAYDELLYLVNKYKIPNVFVVDEIIEMSYFDDFLPRLRDTNTDIALFYETKANLKKEQLKLMKQAKILMFQPGIESLNTETLKLMRKGITAIQNIQLLKWCAEFSLDPIWNILWGFPKEQAAYYQELPVLIRKITHFPPPDGVARLKLHRFSPLFSMYEKNADALDAYSIIYPFAQNIINNIAYLFKNNMIENDIDESFLKPFKTAITNWNAEYHYSTLNLIEGSGEHFVLDTRVVATEMIYRPNEIEVAILKFFDAAKSQNQLTDYLQQNNFKVDDERIGLALHSLMQRNFLIYLDDRYLSLVISSNKLKNTVNLYLHAKTYDNATKVKQLL